MTSLAFFGLPSLGDLWDAIHEIYVAILCVLAVLFNIILGTLVAFLNLIIISISGWVQLLTVLLPGMPDQPDNPAPEVLLWLNWIFPIDGFIIIFYVVLMMWLTIAVIRAVYRILGLLG